MKTTHNHDGTPSLYVIAVVDEGVGGTAPRNARFQTKVRTATTVLEHCFESFILWLMHALCAYLLVTGSSASRCGWQQQPIGAHSSSWRPKAPIIQAMKGRRDGGAVDRAAALLVRCLCTLHLLSALSTTPINRIQQPRTQPSGLAGTCSSPQNCCKKEVWRVPGARSSSVGTARTR